MTAQHTQQNSPDSEPSPPSPASGFAAAAPAAASTSSSSERDPHSPLSHFCRSVLAGGFASTIAKTAVAPGERVRIILQTRSLFDSSSSGASSSSAAAARQASSDGVLALVRHIVSSEKGGVRALWRGNLANCLRSFPSYALRFSLFDSLRAASPASFHDSFGGALLLGAFSGATTTFVTYPLDLIRTKMSVDSIAAANNNASTAASEAVGRSDTRHRGMVHHAAATLRRGGFWGLYRGLTMSIIEIMPYTAISLGGYDFAKTFIVGHRQDQSPPGVIQKLAVGWSVGLTASLVCYPLDTIKRHVMLETGDVVGTVGSSSSSTGRSSLKNSPILRHTRGIFARHGLGGFYRGCLVNAVKSAPAAAIALVANDTLKQLFGL